VNKTIDDYRGKLCPSCSAILGYTPHAPWCGYYRPGLIGNMIEVSNPDTHARASEIETERYNWTASVALAREWRSMSVEQQFERQLTQADRLLLAGMKIALN